MWPRSERPRRQWSRKRHARWPRHSLSPRPRIQGAEVGLFPGVGSRVSWTWSLAHPPGNVRSQFGGGAFIGVGRCRPELLGTPGINSSGMCRARPQTRAHPILEPHFLADVRSTPAPDLLTGFGRTGGPTCCRELAEQAPQAHQWQSWVECSRLAASNLNRPRFASESAAIGFTKHRDWPQAAIQRIRHRRCATKPQGRAPPASHGKPAQACDFRPFGRLFPQQPETQRGCASEGARGSPSVDATSTPTPAWLCSRMGTLGVAQGNNTVRLDRLGSLRAGPRLGLRAHAASCRAL